MVLPLEKWHKAMQIRRSRRTYTSKEIDKTVLERLMELINELNGLYDEARIVFINHSPEEAFANAVGPYGKITGASAYLAIISTSHKKFSLEKAGFIGQGIVLEAVLHGLSTCWVGGYFSNLLVEKFVSLTEEEKVCAVIPIGYARKNLSLTEKMMNQAGDYQKRKSVITIAEGTPRKEWSKVVEALMNAASIAPSAYNRQSVRYFVDGENQIKMLINNPYEETNVAKEIDRGVAMLHLAVAAENMALIYEWDFDCSTDVVLFKFKER